jgi:glycerate 2-kinase
MNILAAPNSMKGSLSAPDFSIAIENGFRNVSPVFNVRRLPIADGGDYTGPILCDALKAKRIKVSVSDPFGRQIEAEMGIAGETAIIEMASASGLRLLNPLELNPMKATTYGTGQLIKRVIEFGCSKILLGVGGSATVDGGIGILDALGFTFYDINGDPLPGNPESLEKVNDIHFPSKITFGIDIIILCDVNNPMLGENGAASVFGPQKGANKEMVIRLEKGLTNWADVLERISEKEIRNMEGMGAAGGVASALIAMLNARLVEGASAIFDILDLDKHIGWADLIITGEGKIDTQSLALKAPVALASKAKYFDKPVIAMAGAYGLEMEKVFDGVFPIVNGPIPLSEAMQNAMELVIKTSMHVAGLILRSNSDLYKNHLLCESAKKHLMKGEINNAVECIERIDNQTAVYWYLKGLKLQKEQNWGAALNCFLKTLEIDPGYEQAQTSIGIIRNILNFTNPSLLDP